MVRESEKQKKPASLPKRLFERGARKLGLHPLPAPMAINSEFVSRPAGLRALRLLSWLRVRGDGQGVDADDDDSGSGGDGPLRSAARKATSSRIETDNAGRATGVSYFDRDKRERFQRARAVVVCANGAETPRLLLMSASAQFPAGAGEFERARRQIPDVQLRVAASTPRSSTS